jgi:hypothetical protein
MSKKKAIKDLNEPKHLKVTTYTKEKSVGRVVKEEKKYLEVKQPLPASRKPKKKKFKKRNKILPGIVDPIDNLFNPSEEKILSKDDELFGKIKVAEPEDWLKNIKTV